MDEQTHTRDKKTDDVPAIWKVLVENERGFNRTLEIEARDAHELVQRDVTSDGTDIESAEAMINGRFSGKSVNL